MQCSAPAAADEIEKFGGVMKIIAAKQADVSVDAADGCETDTDADQTERWYEVSVDEWAGLRSEYADA